MLKHLPLIALVALALFFGYSGHAVASGAHVDGSSMEPTLHDGQYVFLDRATYSVLRGPHYGDIIVFKAPPDPSKDYVKRVIGVPGDTVEIRDGVLYVNGDVADHSYLKGKVTIGDYPKTVVPDDDFFVMGDNRNASSDSRAWGFVPRDNIVGRVLFAYWPVSASHHLDFGAFGVSVSIPVPF